MSQPMTEKQASEIIEAVTAIRDHLAIMIEKFSKIDEDKGEDLELWVFRPIEQGYLACPMAKASPRDRMHADNRNVAFHLMNERREFAMWIVASDIPAFRERDTFFIANGNVPHTPAGME